MTEWLGLLRSFVIYWRPGRQRRLRQLYQHLVGPGDLVFDIGAHLGDRTLAFATLGARVVALEPQPQLFSWLKYLVGRHARVTVRTEAVGRGVGIAQLAISRRTPTVSTLAKAWRQQIPETNPSFRHVRWDRVVDVPVTTLDALIDTYGLPKFCKIDVEGYEAEVLAGLSHQIPRMSLEFVSGSLDIAVSCVRRLNELGTYEFNAVPGEQRCFIFDHWVTSNHLLEWLGAGAKSISSGDLYAQLVQQPH